MKTSAVICEYNPFHNGHKFQTDTARELTQCDAVIALMSGNYVQRGDFALFDKYTRAKAALQCGADLVLENPTVCVLRSAEGYASAAVRTLTALGCVDNLVFGAECDDADMIYSIAQLLAKENDEFRKILSEALSEGISYASARGRAVGRILGEEAEKIMRQPNNILAVEYVKAIIRQKSPLKPFAIKRMGVGHNSDKTSENIASASYIRDEFYKNGDEAFEFVPEEAAKIYCESRFYPSGSADRAILAAINLMSAEALRKVPDISEGLENKIKTEAMKQTNLGGLIEAVKSKRYAYSRIRRALLCAYLGISEEDTAREPGYIKILDFNRTGQTVLNVAKKTAEIPLAKSAAPLRKSPELLARWKRELEFDRIYDIFAQNI